jgi:hypothetical protein
MDKSILWQYYVSSSAVAKTIKRYDETGSHEDHHRNEEPELPLLQREVRYQPQKSQPK